MIKTGKDINCDIRTNEDPRYKIWILKEVPEFSKVRSGETIIKAENAFGIYKKEDYTIINRED